MLMSQCRKLGPGRVALAEMALPSTVGLQCSSETCA